MLRKVTSFHLHWGSNERDSTSVHRIRLNLPEPPSEPRDGDRHRGVRRHQVQKRWDDRMTSSAQHRAHKQRTLPRPIGCVDECSADQTRIGFENEDTYEE
jgi:hypothetical protein